MTSLLKKKEKDGEEESHRPLFLDREIDEVTTGLAPASSAPSYILFPVFFAPFFILSPAFSKSSFTSDM